ncbi:MAG: TIGR02757 family protein [Flavobacteriales bacterium]|nr:TIGR02757 family protein [Flavobacteriales bacterium]
MSDFLKIKSLLDDWYQKTNHIRFIENDPISIPHKFRKLPDIEIAGFFAAIMAWGNRKTIVLKCTDLLNRMDNAPHDFVSHAKKSELERLKGFVHRTLNETDVLYLVDFFCRWYAENDSLEKAFSRFITPTDTSVEKGLIGFRNLVFNTEYVPKRTQKHISSPVTNSATKRINMYLRWMVRKDRSGVDFGLWNDINPNQLVCPLDVHVHRVASHLDLLTRPQSDWKAAIELTNNLKKFDADDPIKYDFALFGLGLAGFAK